MDFQIELQPHIGERQVGGVVRTVEFDQYQIFVTGEKLKEARGVERELIGYAGKRPGAPIQYLKVVAAFGPAVTKMFSAMIRAAMLEKMRERVAKAREAREEAEQLRAEVEQFADEARKLAIEESDADAARKLAEEAIAEATKELEEASQGVVAEESSERPANEPNVGTLEESSRTNSKPTATIDELAEQQNL